MSTLTIQNFENFLEPLEYPNHKKFENFSWARGNPNHSLKFKYKNTTNFSYFFLIKSYKPISDPIFFNFDKEFIFWALEKLADRPSHLPILNYRSNESFESESFGMTNGVLFIFL